MLTKAQRLRQQLNRESADISILSDSENAARNFLIRKYARLLARGEPLPMHLAMYRNLIEENVIEEPPVQGVPEPCDTERASLEAKWGPLDQRP